jgi:hypothetical protein
MGKAASRVAVSLAQLAATCKVIGNESADEMGFVAVRTLLKTFRAELIIRPLLVEAMIASLEAGDAKSTGKSRWVVLVDSERYSVTEDALRTEAHGRSLPVRFRTTIAHELAHSVAFRPAEFGIRSLVDQGSSGSRGDFVATVERGTDQMSPLLLLPEKTLTKLFSGKHESLTASDLQSTCRTLGISRHVIINRLMLLLRRDDTNDLIERRAVANVGIGMGEWTEAGEAVLRKWPLFINFQNGIVPSLLGKLAKQDHLAVRALIEDSNFVLCGGRAQTVDFTCKAGLHGSGSEKMRARWSVESVAKRPGAQFMFTISKWDDNPASGFVAANDFATIRRKHGADGA